MNVYKYTSYLCMNFLFFVSFIYSEIVSQIVSTLFVEQLHLLAIVCLAMKGNDATTGIIVAVLPEVCIHYSS